MEYIENLFKGRLSLGNFWIGLLLIIIACFPIGFIIFTLLNLLFPTDVSNLISTPFFIAILVLFYSMTIRRLHDVNKSGWFGLGVYLPIFGLYVLYLIFLETGQSDDNKYGKVPDKKINIKNILGLSNKN
jgi:uncharacterized membrane protein YhaH (DUF805 family)